MIWPFWVLLITSIIVASVVLFPEPVGPVTKTKPVSSVGIERIYPGRFKSSKLGIFVVIILKISAYALFS